MQLMTQKIAAKLLAADRQVIETGEGPDEIAVKFFNPCGTGTWYITSGTPLDENGEPVKGDAKRIAKHWRLFDWHLFGLCDQGEPELGYVLLSELQGTRLRFGLTIERDLYYDGKTLADAQKACGRAA